MHPTPTDKGTVPFGEFRTWYRVTGERSADRPTAVVLHGGPGSTHDYLLRLSGLAREDWAVVHYDQLGNGGSTRLADRPSGFWTTELFLAELDNLLRGLGIADDYVLIGHSWGGVLATAHAQTRPSGLRGLVVANAPPSYPLWRRELAVLRTRLPADVAAVLTRHETAGTTDEPEYQEACRVFYDRHVCRILPWPRDLLASHWEICGNPTVYLAMNGPTEFHVTGSLRDWSLCERSPVEVPVLLLSGAHDEVTPAAMEPFRRITPHARRVVFPRSSHLPHLEEPALFDAVLIDFLRSLV